MAAVPKDNQGESSGGGAVGDASPGIHYDADAAMFRRYVPPHDLPAVHEEILAQIRDIEMRLKSIERDFYGNTTDLQFTKRLAAMIKPVQDVTDVMAISSRKDMENILMIIKDKMSETKLDDAVARLEAYNKKMNFYVPKCLKLMQEVYALTRETEKYCQSGYDSETMVELGTSKDYEDLRKSIFQAINESLKRLRVMWQRYDSGTGLDLPSFSQPIAGFSLECECTRQMFLLMFPEGRDTITEAAEKLREWVRTDKSYITYLEGDRVYLEEGLEDIDRQLLQLRARYHNAVSNYEVLNEQLNDAKRNFGAGNVREMLHDLEFEDQQLRNKLRERNSYLHGLGLDRLAVKRRIREHPAVCDTKENRERADQLSGHMITAEHEIRQIKYDIKRISQKMLVARVFNGRKTLLEEKLDNTTKLIFDLESQIKNLNEKHSKMKAQLDLAASIIRVKGVPNAAYNIYYNLSRKPTDQDPVMLACGVVSKHIRHKWPLLYRSLPFHGRGIEEVDVDVKEISERPRVTTADRANRALQRWRRFNAKASLSDIKKALNQIQEPKLWTRIQRVTKLDENVYEEEEEEDQLRHIPQELRPFYLKIERFDSMRQRLAEEAARQRQKEEILKKYSGTKTEEEVVAEMLVTVSATF